MMKRILSLLLPLAVTATLVGCTAPAPAPPPTEPVAPLPEASEPSLGKLLVTGSALNVRSGPATSHERIEKLRRGAHVDLLGEDGAWRRVRLADGREGWVHGRYVRAAPECPDDRDAVPVEMPPPRMSSEGGRGRVVVEVLVETDGSVSRTRLVSNTTGDEALATYYLEGLEQARFEPAIRDCRSRRALLVLPFEN